MTIHDILQACRSIKEAGTSSKVPLPITVIESLCRDALMWRNAPEAMRDAIKFQEARQG